MVELKIALKNVKAYWKHSLTAILAIASGVASISLFQGYVDHISLMFYESIAKIQMIGDVVIESKALETPKGRAEIYQNLIDGEFKESLEHSLKNSQMVSLFVPFLSLQGMISNGPKNTIFFGFGYDVEKGRAMRTSYYDWDTFHGYPLHKNSNSSSLVLGGSLAKLLDCQETPGYDFYAEDTWLNESPRSFHCKQSLMQLSSNTVHEQFNAVNLEVSGLIDGGYKEIDSRYVQMSLENAQMLMDTKGVSRYGVRLKNKKDFQKFKKNLISSMITRHPKVESELTIKLWEDHIIGEIYKKNMSLFAVFRNFVLTIIVMVCGLSVFNTMLKIVLERTREMGIYRSLGFSSDFIKKQFLYEGMLISLVGVTFGIISSFLITKFFNGLHLPYKAGMLTKPVLFYIATSFKLYVLSSLVMIFISYIGTKLALMNSHRKTIIEYLTHA